MKMSSRTLLIVSIAAIACLLTFAAASAGEVSKKINATSVASKHYDPSHVGHSHQCYNCRQFYNQQGDNGPYSSGSNVCPYCGYTNPVPPTQPQTNTNMTWTEGRDGVRIYYPASGWTWTEGRDGRRVVYPVNGWTWTEGRDGRRIAYPVNGWTWTEGNDGVRAVYPVNGWTWTEGRDGHRVVYPTSGWTWTERSDGRRVVYPYGGYSNQDHTYMLISLLSREVRLAPQDEPYRDLVLRQMRIVEY